MHSLHLSTKLADCYKNGTCRIVFSGWESLGHCPLAARFYLWNYKMWTGREITTATSYASQERYPGAVFPCHQQVGEKSNKATVRSTLPGKRHLRGRVIIEYAVNRELMIVRSSLCYTILSKARCRKWIQVFQWCDGGWIASALHIKEGQRVS